MNIVINCAFAGQATIGKLLDNLIKNELSISNIDLNNFYVKDASINLIQYIANIFGSMIDYENKLADILVELKKSVKKLGKKEIGCIKFVLDTCYDEHTAKRLQDLINDLASRLSSSSSDQSKSKCSVALILLAYYLAMLKIEEKKCNDADAEDWIVLGDLLRSFASKDKRSIIRLCPWKGDVTALLYAAIYYCCRWARSGNGNVVNATVKAEKRQHNDGSSNGKLLVSMSVEVNYQSGSTPSSSSSSSGSS